jgi:hypothetical protein
MKTSFGRIHKVTKPVTENDGTRQELVFRDLAAFVIFSPISAILLSRSRFSLSQ